MIANHYPWFLATYDGYDCNIKRVDAARYFILHKHGGIYADLDFVLLRSLEPYLSANDLLLAYEAPGMIGNAIMGSCTGHPLMLAAISDLERTKDRQVLHATGPIYLSSHVNKSFYLNEMHSSLFFYPYPWDHPDKTKYASMSLEVLRETFPDAISITHWTGSWLAK